MHDHTTPSPPSPIDRRNTDEQAKDAIDELVVKLREAAWRVIKRKITVEGPSRASLLPLRWLDPEEVADRAGLDVDVFEELWGKDAASQPDPTSAFEAFVLEALSVGRTGQISEGSSTVLPALPGSPEALMQLGRFRADFDPQKHAGHHVALAMSCYSTKPRPDVIADIADIAAALELWLYDASRRLIGGLTIQHLSAVVSALLEAPWLNAILGVEDPRPSIELSLDLDSEPKRWTIDAMAIWAVVSVMTEPISAGGPA